MRNVADEPNPLDAALIPPGARIEIPLLRVSIEQLREIAEIVSRLGRRLDVLVQSGDTERHIKIDAWFLIRQARETILRIKKHNLGDEEREGEFRRTLSGNLVKLGS